MARSRTGESEATSSIADVLRKVGGYVRWKVGNVYWEARGGTQSLTVDGTTVRFGATADEGGAINRRRFAIEREVLQDLLRSLKPNDVFYDVGANTGLYTCFAARRLDRGTVVAFEPYSPNVRQLERNISYNGLDNIDIRNVALSDSSGQIGFQQPSEARVGYGKGAIETHSDGPTTVSTTTGDRLVTDGDCPPPDVIKFDVEGAEQLVLDGLESTLTSGPCRLLYCEVHSAGGPKRLSQSTDRDVSAVERKLREYGFRTESLHSSGKVQIKGYA